MEPLRVESIAFGKQQQQRVDDKAALAKELEEFLLSVPNLTCKIEKIKRKNKYVKFYLVTFEGKIIVQKEADTLSRTSLLNYVRNYLSFHHLI